MNPYEALQTATGTHNHIFLCGPNFSGRSAALQYVTYMSTGGDPGTVDDRGVQLPARPCVLNGDRFAYVGPEIYQSLSGLASNARAELLLHSWVSTEHVERVAETLGLAPLLSRSCFELSGGQQALLAAASGALLRPRVLALDCCLEQVDATRRDTLLSLLSEVAPKTVIAVADNEIQQLFALPGTLTLHLDAIEGPTVYGRINASLCKHCQPARVEAPLLELRNLSVGYGKSDPVLKDVSIALKPGHVYWLRGPNGSGKSTLAKLLAGVLKPSKGAVLAAGKNVEPHRSPGFLAAYHFQNPDFQLFTTAVRDEVFAGPAAMGCSPAEAAKRADSSLAQMGFPAELHTTHPLDLPFAIRKRLALAATIAQGSPWIIFDEPSLNQDASNTAAIRSLLAALAETGMGVIVISHSESLLHGLVLTELRIQDGRLSLAAESTNFQAFRTRPSLSDGGDPDDKLIIRR